MTLIEGIIFGIIQGIAEFLPISSSGHLALAHNFFGTNEVNSLAFDILLHIATLLAVIIVYRKDVWLLIKGFFTLIGKVFTGKLKSGLEYGEKLFLMVAIATVPLLPAMLVKDYVEAVSGISWAIGCLLIVNGIMLFVSDKLASGKIKLENAGFLRPLLVGVVQMVGILPGISRSGSTITGGRLVGLNRSEAVKFSFLMSIPAILGAAVLELPDFFKEGISQPDILPVAAGAFCALAVGLGAIKLLQYISKNKTFTVFAVYSVVVGAAAVIYDLAF